MPRTLKQIICDKPKNSKETAEQILVTTLPVTLMCLFIILCSLTSEREISNKEKKEQLLIDMYHHDKSIEERQMESYIGR